MNRFIAQRNAVSAALGWCRAWRPLRSQGIAAAVALVGANPLIAEPYSGGPADDPLVRFVAWSIVGFFAAVFALLVALGASRARFRSRRFYAAFAIAFPILLGSAVLIGALGVVMEIVSLVLHLLL